MIYYVVTARHSYTMEYYLKTWGRALNRSIQLVFYEELAGIQRLPFGTYIFSDLERLSSAHLRLAAEVWEQLAPATPSVRLLNHPLRTFRRYQLLSRLYELKMNSFRVTRASDLATPHRFPVFIRDENEHGGSRTGLLRGEHELSVALKKLQRRGLKPHELLIVEFCDTSDRSGVFRKYSAFIIGGRIVPRHLIFSSNWVLKTADLGTEDMLREERRYMEENPDQEWLKKIFALANVDYGRIDYSFLDGKPQIWEINTNPMVLMRPKDYEPLHQPGQELFARLILPLFQSIDTAQDESDSIPLSIPPELIYQLPGETWTRSLRRVAKHVRNKIWAQPNVPILTGTGRAQGSSVL
jgi:hypothetical protein